jgi:hypothetical protein
MGRSTLLRFRERESINMPVGRSKLLDSWNWIRSTEGMNGRRGMEVETLIQAFSLIMERDIDRAFYWPRYGIPPLV